MRKKIKAVIYLFLCAIIWGGGFVVQRDGMETMGPFMFSAIRMLFASITLIPLVHIFSKKNFGQSKGGKLQSPIITKDLIIGGLCCGMVLFLGTNLQQMGLVSTNAGKSAFITTLYIVIVPILGLFLKHAVSRNNWIGVLLGTMGLYFLSITENFTMTIGDTLTLIGALFWALHILFTSHFVTKADAIALVSVQSFVASVLSLISAIMVGESLSLEIVQINIGNLLYAGMFSAGIAFMFQALGQRDLNPTASSLILCTEAVFAGIFGVLILNEAFTSRELIGCALLLVSLVITQIPVKKEVRS